MMNGLPDSSFITCAVSHCVSRSSCRTAGYFRPRGKEVHTIRHVEFCIHTRVSSRASSIAMSASRGSLELYCGLHHLRIAILAVYPAPGRGQRQMQRSTVEGFLVYAKRGSWSYGRGGGGVWRGVDACKQASCRCGREILVSLGRPQFLAEARATTR